MWIIFFHFQYCNNGESNSVNFIIFGDDFVFFHFFMCLFVFGVRQKLRFSVDPAISLLHAQAMKNMVCINEVNPISIRELSLRHCSSSVPMLSRRFPLYFRWKTEELCEFSYIWTKINRRNKWKNLTPFGLILWDQTNATIIVHAHTKTMVMHQSAHVSVF